MSVQGLLSHAGGHMFIVMDTKAEYMFKKFAGYFHILARNFMENQQALLAYLSLTNEILGGNF